MENEGMPQNLVLKHLGKDGYKKIVTRCRRLTWKLAREIQEIQGLEIATEPTMNIAGIKSKVFNIRQIAKELRLRKWAVSLFPNHIRIVVMPHVQKQHVEKFLSDLKDITNRLGG